MYVCVCMYACMYACMYVEDIKDVFAMVCTCACMYLLKTRMCVHTCIVIHA